MTVYAKFQIRSKEDRKAMEELGGLRTKPVDFAILRMSGDKHTELEIEITPEVISDWQSKEHMVDTLKSYKNWKEGLDEPVNGIPLEQWPNINMAQIEQAKALNIRTVEDFAELSEAGCNAYGMGAQMLKNKAKSYLEAASGAGKITEQMTAMQAQMQLMQDQLNMQNKALMDKDAVIATLIPEDKKPKKKNEAA